MGPWTAKKLWFAFSELHGGHEVTQQLVELVRLFEHYEMAGALDPHNLAVGKVRRLPALLSRVMLSPGNSNGPPVSLGAHIAKDAFTAIRSEASVSIIFFTFSLISGVAVEVMPLIMFSRVLRPDWQ